MKYPTFEIQLNTMKKQLIVYFFLISISGIAQNADWGTGLQISVTPQSTDLNLSVFDPILGSNVTYNLYTGSGLIYRNVDGVVVAYGSNNDMTFATYDWALHAWKSGSIYIGSANSKILTADGIVAGYGSNNDLAYAIYDVNQQSWKTGTQYIGSSNDTIIVADGIVAGYGSNNDLAFATYDAQLQSWRTSSIYLGSSNAIIASADGVVIGYGSNNDLVYATYDIELQSWKTGSTYIGSSNFQIATLDGIVAGYGSNNDLECAIYDFNTSSWKTNSIYIGSQGTFTLSSGTITYNGSSSGITGYNSGTQSWQSAPTSVECKLLPYGVTNSSWVRMQCMSIGAGTFTYSCGDGHQINRRAGWKKYNLNNSYNALLNVSNGVNNSSCDAIIDITSGLEEVNNNLFTVFPNPTSNLIHIHLPFPQTFELKLLNYLGQTVFQQSILNEVNAELSVSTKGIYILQFTTKDRTYFQKIEVIN